LKEFITIFCLILISPSFLFSQRWDRYYGEPDRGDYSYDIIETYDKGYLISGGYNNLRSWLIKTDINGNVLWDKVIESDGHNLSRAVIQSSDGGFVVAGQIAMIDDYLDPFIMKLNPCGDKKWCKIFHVPYQYYSSSAFDIIETCTKDLVFIANTYGELEIDPLYLFKLDSLGEVKWKNPYLTLEEHPTSIAPLAFNLLQTSDSGYLIACDAYWSHP
jgi:hypothetical protein